MKAHGTGNDFILLRKEKCPEIIQNPEFIAKLCTRRTGIGADGLIIISKDSRYDFKMDYFNCDGTWETFCANGARCAVKLMNQMNHSVNKMTFAAGDGIHSADLENDKVRLKMKTPEYKTNVIEVENYSGILVDSGARHFVTEVNNFYPKLVEKSAPKIRYADIFQPKGVNVNFYEIIDQNNMKVWTYEKGIEKLMLSCGSGSTAAVYHGAQTGKLKSPVTCIELGGNLKVEFDEDCQNVWLTGDAVILFESEINTNNF